MNENLPADTSSSGTVENDHGNDAAMKRREKIFSRMKTRAVKVAENRNKTLLLLDTAIRKLSGGVPLLESRGFSEKLRAAVRLVRLSVLREYPDVPWKTVLLIIAAIIYFVSPLDAIADIIPFLGYTDDIAVISAVINSVNHDIERFLQWEQEIASGNPASDAVETSYEELDNRDHSGKTKT